MKSISYLTFGLILLFACSEREEASIDLETKIADLAVELNVDLVVDESVTPENSISIRSLEEMKNFILEKQLEYMVATINDEVKEFNNSNQYMRCPDQNGYYVASLSEGPFSVNFGISIENGRITRVNPFLTGITIVNSYTDGGYGFEDYGNQTIIKTTGSINYNIFMEGIGTIYSMPVSYKITLGCTGVEKITRSDIFKR